MTLIAAPLLAAGLATPSEAFDANDKLSVNVTIAGAAQCLDLDAGGGSCEGAVALQPEISLKPTKRDEIFVKFGFAEGNALGRTTPFALSAWAADLEADLDNINGHARDHLLTAWYQHTFEIRDGTELAVTGGIIDATDYLDDNRFANDEFGQFLNEVFVNAPTAALPSYDYGGAATLDLGSVALRGVVMDIKQNESGNGYTFIGGQAALTTKSALGEGIYRVIVTGTSSAFPDPAGTHGEGLSSVTLSLDQDLGKHVGLFARLGWQDDAAAITHGALYSGGIQLGGGLWCREGDTVGVGFAHLDDGNDAVASSRVFEAYYRLGISERFALTADVQHMTDRLAAGGGPRGTIVSLRGTAEF